MANGLPIDIETFRNLKSSDAKLDALFDVLAHMNSSGYECESDREERLKTCEDRFKALEKGEWRDRGFAGGMGLIGGFLAGFFKGG